MPLKEIKNELIEDLTGIDFSETKFINCIFKGKLSALNLSNCAFIECKFSVDASYLNFRNSIFTQCNFHIEDTISNFYRSDFNQTTFSVVRKVRFKICSFHSAVILRIDSVNFNRCSTKDMNIGYVEYSYMKTSSKGMRKVVRLNSGIQDPNKNYQTKSVNQNGHSINEDEIKGQSKDKKDSKLDK